MNHCVPHSNIDYGDLPVANHKKALGSDDELIELLWRNGQVVMHSQTQRKPGPNTNESRQVHRHDQLAVRGSGSYGNSSNLIQDDETVSWIHYPLDDSLEKEFSSNFFCELPSSDPIESGKQMRQFEEDKLIKFGASETSTTDLVASSQQPIFKQFAENPMPPPRFQFPDSAQQNPSMGEFGKVVNFSPSVRAGLGSSNGQFGGNGSGNMTQGEVTECSGITVGSSHCGSNQVRSEADLSRVSSSGVGTTGLSAGPVKDDVRKVILQCERGQTETLEPTFTSSSGGSDSSFGRTCKQSTGIINRHKRKGRDAEESECQSQAPELESAAGNKPAQRSTRRSRAAEVHNLSERRRRDRINEKMRALQELIPHCNKSDKASMLDEAIEYLKSLQLQLQFMWMGSGMAPMMFPGVQHYMSRMGMGMGIGQPPLPSIHNPMHLPRVPLVDQAMSVAPTLNQATMCQTPVLNPVNYQNQMQNPNFSEQYACYMGFHPMQTASQPMNMFSFGSQTVQPSDTIAPPGSSTGPSIGRGAI